MSKVDQIVARSGGRFEPWETRCLVGFLDAAGLHICDKVRDYVLRLAENEVGDLGE